MAVGIVGVLCIVYAIPQMLGHGILAATIQHPFRIEHLPKNIVSAS
jgi:hypothetical protein